MTAIILPNWLWFVIAGHYILVAVVFTVRFIIDMFVLRRILRIEKDCGYGYPLFKINA